MYLPPEGRRSQRRRRRELCCDDRTLCSNPVSWYAGPNPCSPDSSLKCLFNFSTHRNLGDTARSQLLLRVTQTHAVFQRWARITAYSTDRASCWGDRHSGTSKCKVVWLCSNWLTSTRAHGRILLYAHITRKSFL